jgi:uncharacterized protein YkwD
MLLTACGGSGPNACDLNPASMVAHITAVRGESVKWSFELAAAAQAHANDLERSGIATHTGTDGSTHIDRARRAGWPSDFVAENLVMGDVRNQAHALELLDASPQHLRNTTWPGMTHIGAGCAGGVAWVVELGA